MASRKLRVFMGCRGKRSSASRLPCMTRSIAAFAPGQHHVDAHERACKEREKRQHIGGLRIAGVGKERGSADADDEEADEELG